MRLENDGRIYASVAGTSTILAINTNLTTGFSLTLADTSILTGHLAQPVFKVVPAGDVNHALYARSAGLKKYELKDHLGNVRVVVSDRLTASGALPGKTNDAELLSYNHYYPFGMLQPGRNFAANTYRFGFGGFEKDDEVFGSTGSSYTTDFRQYDPRNGRWWSMDPKRNLYPGLSPYQYAGNNPIFYIDPDGQVIKIYLTGNSLKSYNSSIKRLNSNAIFNYIYSSMEDVNTLYMIKTDVNVGMGRVSHYNTNWLSDKSAWQGEDYKHLVRFNSRTAFSSSNNLDVTISEEVFHVGQGMYYGYKELNNGMVTIDQDNRLLLEVEARVFRAFSGQFQDGGEDYIKIFASNMNSYFEAIKSGNSDEINAQQDWFRANIEMMAESVTKPIEEGGGGYTHLTKYLDSYLKEGAQTPFFDNLVNKMTRKFEFNIEEYMKKNLYFKNDATKVVK